MKVLLFVIIFELFSMTLNAKEKIILNTLNWEPYISEELPENGPLGKIVREAFQKAGYDVEYVFLPWKRTVLDAKAGNANGYFPEYFANYLKEEFILSDSIPGGPLVFLTLKNNKINFTNLSELKPYEIGVVRGYINTEEFDQADFLHKQEAVDDLTNLRKLFAKRIDLMLCDSNVGFYLTQKHYPSQLSNIKIIDPPLDYKSLYICFSKKKPKNDIVTKKFNKAINEMKQKGRIKDIYKEFGLK